MHGPTEEWTDGCTDKISFLFFLQNIVPQPGDVDKSSDYLLPLLNGRRNSPRVYVKLSAQLCPDLRSSCLAQGSKYSVSRLTSARSFARLFALTAHPTAPLLSLLAHPTASSAPKASVALPTERKESCHGEGAYLPPEPCSYQFFTPVIFEFIDTMCRTFGLIFGFPLVPYPRPVI